MKIQYGPFIKLDVAVSEDKFRVDERGAGDTATYTLVVEGKPLAVIPAKEFDIISAAVEKIAAKRRTG